MKVKELIAELQKADPESLVILQKDAEGNGYSPCEGVDYENNVYIPGSTWSGEVMYKYPTLELIRSGYSEEDFYNGPDAVDCVVLYPVN